METPKCQFVPAGEGWTCPHCNQGPVRSPHIKRICLLRPEPAADATPRPKRPAGVRRLVNFSRAAIAHHLAGAPTCNQIQIDARLAICRACPLYLPDRRHPETGVCGHPKCGCNVSRQERYLNKLAWADQCCPDHPPRWDAVQPLTRNLLFHCMPTANGVWRRHAEQLARRIHTFNGKRVLAIATGQDKEGRPLAPPAEVREVYAPLGMEVIEIKNVPRLREVASFLPLFERVANANDNEITFYAHSKGATKPVDDGVTVHRWADVMYASLLDHLPLVEDLLATHAFAGSFKIVGRKFPGSKSRWHYSGSFFWLRHRDVFAGDWRRIDRRWYGIESWPALHAAAKQAAEVFGSSPAQGDLYVMERWKQVEKDFAAWEELQNAKCKLQIAN